MKLPLFDSWMLTAHIFTMTGFFAGFIIADLVNIIKDKKSVISFMVLGKYYLGK